VHPPCGKITCHGGMSHFQYKEHSLNSEFKLMRMFVLFKALPLFLDSIFPSWAAILMSVTLVLAFAEVKSILHNPLIVETQKTWVVLSIYLFTFFL
jgi:hypothetical protein